ncbi:hypothetical protein E2C01_082106 [Portunus trituberculatus]|uniref:Uncharacterized protein n=1 Tax=Portunus trituberculatus TaxID=210409 RepID=A0A5B7IY74_PORTR|nr:hypothetical protein [Portunus trituberculatus]
MKIIFVVLQGLGFTLVWSCLHIYTYLNFFKTINTHC